MEELSWPGRNKISAQEFLMHDTLIYDHNAQLALAEEYM